MLYYYEAIELCEKCKGCEAVADGEAQCYIELENIYAVEEE